MVCFCLRDWEICVKCCWNIKPSPATDSAPLPSKPSPHQSIRDRGNVQGNLNNEDARQTPNCQLNRSGCTRTTAEDIARNTRILAEETGRTGAGADGMCCWESESVLQAYRTAAARTVRRVSSALFGRELLAVEAAKTSAAERERMLEGRARELFDSQVSVVGIGGHTVHMPKL